jgi:hypothetical protein
MKRGAPPTHRTSCQASARHAPVLRDRFVEPVKSSWFRADRRRYASEAVSGAGDMLSRAWTPWRTGLWTVTQRWTTGTSRADANSLALVL